MRTACARRACRLAAPPNGWRLHRDTIGSELRLLTLGQPPRKTALQAHLQSRQPLALLVALVLCLFAFVFAANVAWAKEQPSSKEQQQPRGESTTIVNGTQVAEPAPTPTPVVTSTPPVETSSIDKLTRPPADLVPPKADPEPAPQPTSLQRTVVVTTTGGETVGPPISAERASAPQKSEPTPTTESATTTTTTTPSKPAPVSASAAPTPNLGSPETELPAAAEEVPAAGGSADVPSGLWAPPSEVAEPVIPAPILQQVAQGGASLQGVDSQEQEAQPGYYPTSAIAPPSAAVQPLTQALNNVIGTSASAVGSAVAGVLGTVGDWLTEAPSSAADNSTSSPEGAWLAPVAPVLPEPLGSSYIGLFSGMGQASTGGAGTTLLLGVLFVASILLLRRDCRMYLVSIELPKPSSALLSPLERPG